MNQITNSLNPTQLGLYEYLLVAHPDASVNQKIIAEKEIFTADYQQKIVAKTKPHITVANFVAREAMEETIIRYTQRICSQQHSFEVALNNYSDFRRIPFICVCKIRNLLNNLLKSLKS